MIMHIEAATKADLPALTKLSQCCLRRRLSSRQIQRFSVAAFQESSRIGRSVSFWLQRKVRRCLEWLFFYTRSQLRLGGESRYLKIWLLALRLAAVALGLISCKGRLRLPKQLGACLSRYSQINRICRLSASTSGMGSRHPPWFRCICIWRSVNRDLPNISSQWTCYAGR